MVVDGGVGLGWGGRVAVDSLDGKTTRASHRGLLERRVQGIVHGLCVNKRGG